MLYKYHLLQVNKDEFDLIKCVIESHIQLAVKRQKTSCLIPTSIFDRHLNYLLQMLDENGFKTDISSTFITIKW